MRHNDLLPKLICVWVALILTSTQFAAADYTLINRRTETVWVAYSVWRPASGVWPAGWRTRGYYRVEPGATQNLSVPQDNIWVYIYVRRGGNEIKPNDHATRDSALFWIHPSKGFVVVETDDGDFLRSTLGRWRLKRADLYQYPNGGSHTIRNLQQQASLAAKVFNKHSKTLQRKDIQAVLPSVFESLKNPKTQQSLNPSTINLVVSNPNLLRRFVPDIDPKFVNLLKRDAQVRRMLRDPQVQTLLQKPAAIDELAGFLRIGEPAVEVRPQLPRTTPQNLPDPKRVFRIRNTTGVTISYQIRWSNNNNWQSKSLETGLIVPHASGGENIASGYPRIRFDHIAGDGQMTYRAYALDTALFRENNNNHAPAYFFEYTRRDRLDLFRDPAAAPTLSKAAPEATVLLTNYPNPSNPETWIPYQLATPAEVTVRIYAADGTLVRMLAVGHQGAGVYQSKSRAAYWDGRNGVGEPVASGVYFYTLTAGDFTATRKMLIRK